MTIDLMGYMQATQYIDEYNGILIELSYFVLEKTNNRETISKYLTLYNNSINELTPIEPLINIFQKYSQFQQVQLQDCNFEYTIESEVRANNQQLKQRLFLYSILPQLCLACYNLIRAVTDAINLNEYQTDISVLLAFLMELIQYSTDYNQQVLIYEIKCQQLCEVSDELRELLSEFSKLVQIITSLYYQQGRDRYSTDQRGIPLFYCTSTLVILSKYVQIPQIKHIFKAADSYSQLNSNKAYEVFTVVENQLRLFAPDLRELLYQYLIYSDSQLIQSGMEALYALVMKIAESQKIQILYELEFEQMLSLVLFSLNSFSSAFSIDQCTKAVDLFSLLLQLITENWAQREYAVFDAIKTPFVQNCSQIYFKELTKDLEINDLKQVAQKLSELQMLQNDDAGRISFLFGDFKDFMEELAVMVDQQSGYDGWEGLM
ncbi:Hypothetical_protein [Hexamita inflata]|uniref:Hypothetical_protein n=1 Tax=Hexamita inflata TaxID=28002 RepID=A0AA86NZY4_9EUKA|nr:Hypothetical protein HINF_LOCUS16626 [Hexamita inflata]